MTQEEKQLLLRDLCARLPYGVKISVQSWDEEEQEYVDRVDELYSVNRDEYIKSANEDYDFSLEDIKPYLFPMPNKDEDEGYNKFLDELIEIELKVISGELEREHSFEFEMNYYHENHMDCVGLIPKGLAKDATGKNIY